jgi:hypothetical protein
MIRAPANSVFVVTGGVAGLALIVIAIVSPGIAAGGWLIGFIAMTAIPLGSLAWLLIHRLTGGHWGAGLRPALLPAAGAVPLLVLGFVPLLAALPLLYPWAAAGAAINPDVAGLYLNVPSFVLRSVIGLLGWSLLALYLPRMTEHNGVLFAGIGLVFHAVIVSVLSTDWILSAQPPFFSTSFGASIAVAQLLAALAFAALFSRNLDPSTTRDLGGLMLTAVLGVTYLNFMTVLVIWYGDLPDRVSWFVERLGEAWSLLAWAAFVFGALAPTVALLFARVRESRAALRWVAVSILTGLACYFAWLITPANGIWTLAAAALALLTLSCAFVLWGRIGLSARLLKRARTAP